jgi:hypothetical protein
VPERDSDVARDLPGTIESARLFLNHGDRHLFADSTVPDHDESAGPI